MSPEFEIAKQSLWWRIGFAVLGVGFMVYGCLGAFNGRIAVGLGRGGTGYVVAGAAAYVAAASAFAFGLFSAWLGVSNRMPPRPLGVAGGVGLLLYFATAVLAILLHHAG